MRLVISTIFFYKKLVLPAITMAFATGFLLMGVIGSFSLNAVGYSYILMGLLFHYFIYEIGNPNEYYFYFNLGLSRYMLWSITLLFSMITGFIFVMI